MPLYRWKIKLFQINYANSYTNKINNFAKILSLIKFNCKQIQICLSYLKAKAATAGFVFFILMYD
jgi:hypothetical protein